MKNSLLILNLIVVLFVTKLKAEPYELLPSLPLQKHTHLYNYKSFYKSLPKNKSTETMVKIQCQESEIERETNKETLDTKEGMGGDALLEESTIKSDVFKMNDIDNITGSNTSKFDNRNSTSKFDIKVGNKTVPEKPHIIKYIEEKVGKNAKRNPPRSTHIDYCRELVHILGLQYKNVEVLSNQNRIDIVENTDEQVIKSNAHEHFPTQKSKLYVVHPYQPQPDMSPAMHFVQHASIMYVDNENVASPSGYYQQYGGNLQHQHSYLSHMDSLSKLFPGFKSESPGFSTINQPMTMKKNYQHSKGSTSKITLERQSMAWPFGYDYTQDPVKYSLLHNIDVVETGKILKEKSSRTKNSGLPSLFSGIRDEGSTSQITLERQSMAWPFGYDYTQDPVKYSLLHNIEVVKTGKSLEEIRLRRHKSGLPSLFSDIIDEGSISRIPLDRQSMVWPFGYDLSQNPVKYSVLEKHDVVKTGKSIEEKSLEEKSLEGKSLEEKSLEEKSLEEKSLEEKSLEEKSLEEKSLEEKTLEEKNFWTKKSGLLTLLSDNRDEL